MKKLLVVLFVLISMLNAKEYTTMKKSCIQQSEHSGKTLDQQKEVLINQAKQLALTDLYGEMMFSKTNMVDGKISSDEIRQRAVGAVRIKGNPKFYNGQNFGEVCTDVTAYVTDKDIKKYSPKEVKLNKYCFNDSTVPMNKIKSEAKYGAYKEIISQYKPSLKLSNEQSEKLIHGFKISNDNFDFDTASYCFNAVATILPYELEMGTNSKITKIKNNKITTKESLDNTIYGKWYGSYYWGGSYKKFLMLEITINKDDTFKATWNRGDEVKNTYHTGTVIKNGKNIILKPGQKNPSGEKTSWTTDSLKLRFYKDELVLEGRIHNYSSGSGAKFVKVNKFPLEYSIENPNDDINGKWYGWYQCTNYYYFTMNISKNNAEVVFSNGDTIVKTEKSNYNISKSRRNIKFDGGGVRVGFKKYGDTNDDFELDNFKAYIDGNIMDGTSSCGSSKKFFATKVSQFPKSF